MIPSHAGLNRLTLGHEVMCMYKTLDWDDDEFIDDNKSDDSDDGHDDYDTSDFDDDDD